MLSNLKVKAKPENLSDFPFLVSDVVSGVGQTTSYYCYGHMRHPGMAKCNIMKEVMDDTTGETVSVEYMLGSTGSQWDFSCDWADRLTGTYAIANTQI